MRNLVIIISFIVSGCSEQTLEEKINNTAIVSDYGSPNWDIAGIKLGHDISVVKHIPLCIGVKPKYSRYKSSDILHEISYVCSNKQGMNDAEYEEISLKFTPKGSLIYIKRLLAIGHHIDINTQITKIKEKYGSNFMEIDHKPRWGGMYQKGKFICFEENHGACYKTSETEIKISDDPKGIPPYLIVNIYTDKHPDQSIIGVMTVNKYEEVKNNLNVAQSYFENQRKKTNSINY